LQVAGGKNDLAGVLVDSTIGSTCGGGSGVGEGVGPAPPCAAGTVTVVPPNPATCSIVEILYDTIDPSVVGARACVRSIDVSTGSPTRSQASFDAFARRQVGTLSWCPSIPPPSLTAAKFFTTRELPSPTLQIQPGEAVVGLLAYLQITGSTSRTFVVRDGFGNTITIQATGSYQVDWGDGTVDDVGQDSGGPYPNGDVTHAYQRSGRFNVVVTETWKAAWSSAGTLGDLAGAIPARTTVGTLPDFPAHDVQANRDQ
jgi:hypothetical protein